MYYQFYSIGLIILLSAMLPGPDFALVVKNTLLYARRGGIFTALGISSALMVHVAYCVMGLAFVISQSRLLFNLIKYLGAAYLLYLGYKTLRAEVSDQTLETNVALQHRSINAWLAFRQGFLCNVLNPKASLFFLALFTLVIKPDTSMQIKLIYGAEVFLIAFCWFCGLSMLLSHKVIAKYFNKIEKYIMKSLGCFLIFFGCAMLFIHR